MNRSVHQLIRDKQTEITEGRERAEKGFVEDGQEEERKALAALMGIPYITLDTFLEDSIENIESLKTAYTQARSNFTEIQTNQKRFLPMLRRRQREGTRRKKYVIRFALL